VNIAAVIASPQGIRGRGHMLVSQLLGGAQEAGVADQQHFHCLIFLHDLLTRHSFSFGKTSCSPFIPLGYGSRRNFVRA
jgi:hypothetical protein